MKEKKSPINFDKEEEKKNKDIKETNDSYINFNEKKENVLKSIQNSNFQPKEEPFKTKKSNFEKIKNYINNFKIKIIKYYTNFSKTKVGHFLIKYFFNKTDLLLFIMNLLSILSYYISLTPCDKDPSECTIKHGMKFYIIIGVFTAISVYLYAIFIIITLNTKKHFVHYLYSIPIFVYLFLKYHGAETVDHGLYNSIGWIGGIIIFTPIFSFIYLIFNLIKKKKYINLIIIFTIIILIIIIYNNLPGFSCDYWDMGLNNTRINNDKSLYPCRIQHPGKNKCYLRRMDGFFDLSRILRPSCSAEKIIGKEKKIFLNSLDQKFFGLSKLNHFGYPITTNSEKYDIYKVKDLKDFQELINHNIIKMDLFNEKNYPNESYPEVELFFDENNHGNIKINISRNETLSEERKEIAKNKSSLYNNVLIIYLDALSRNHFLRKLKKLAKYIEPFMIYNLNETEKKYTTFQFLKYNTLKGLTLPNIKPMFYGVNISEADGENLVKYYKEQGYVTGHTGTTCGREIFSINNIIKSQNLDFNNWDHENIAMFCDENFFSWSYTLYKGVASVLKRCLYGKYAFEYMIEYTKQFWEKYYDNKKFFRIHFNEGHEGTMELVTYLSDPLLEFVKYFFDNNLLDDTFIFIVSDHGNHMPGPWTLIRPRDYIIESTLATLFFIIPNNNKLYKDGLYDIIFKNQQTFITPYDIHDTLIHIAYGSDNAKDAYSRRGSSLLKDIDPMERYCESPKLNLEISKVDCKCKKYD